MFETQISKDIIQYLNPKQKGFYIEAGANDGIFQSNTLALEKIFNWSGMLIEPSHFGYESCKAVRPNNIIHNCCLVALDFKEQYILGDFGGHPMSSVGGKRLRSDNLVSVKAAPIQKLLDDAQITSIDFFSLDTEGYELEVLKGINFDKTTIKVILAELYPTNQTSVFELLKDKYSSPINLSNYTHENSPGWDGTHNDFLFVIK